MSTEYTEIFSVRKALFAAADEDYRRFQCSLMPTVPPDAVIGVRTPILRRMAKDLHGTDGELALLHTLSHTYFEENQLHAFLIEPVRGFDEALALTDAFLPFVDNWATCDQLSPRAFKGNFSDLLPHIRRWMQSPHTYTCRFGMGMLMRYGLDDAFDPAYLSEVAAPAITEREDYYIRMMVAWFFATALAKQYDAAIPYLTERRLPAWTHGKTIQKAIESYRISASHKDFLRTLRD